MGIGRWGEHHTYPPLQVATIAGGAAGNLTVTGIKPTDTLMAVVKVSAAGGNLASEFTISALNTINNSGGTSTAGATVLVMWYSAEAGL